MISEKEIYARNWYCEDQIDSDRMMKSESLGNKGTRFDHKGVTDKTQQCNFLTELQYFRVTTGILLRTKYTTKGKYTQHEGPLTDGISQKIRLELH